MRERAGGKCAPAVKACSVWAASWWEGRWLGGPALEATVDGSRRRRRAADNDNEAGEKFIGRMWWALADDGASRPALASVRVIKTIVFTHICRAVLHQLLHLNVTSWLRLLTPDANFDFSLHPSPG